MNKDKMKTMAFSKLEGSIIFLAIGIWAWLQTDNFPEVANTYVQASTFPRVMIVGMLIFSVVPLKIKKLGVMYLGRIVEMGSRDQVFGQPTDPYTQQLRSVAPEH